MKTTARMTQRTIHQLGLLVFLGASMSATACNKSEGSSANELACFMFAKDQKDRWKPYEPFVKDAGVCMFNKDEKSFSMRSLHDSPPAKPEEVAKRFQTHFEGQGFKMEDRSTKPGVITRTYDKGDKTFLVVTHMTTDDKKVDNTVVDYNPGALK